VRFVPQSITDAWKSEVNLGDESRPVVRATIQRVTLHRTEYDCTKAPGADFGHQKHRRGDLTSLLFGQNNAPLELRNIRSYSWQRSVNQDVAECTLTMLNSELTPIGNQEEADQAGDFDLPGYYTYNRGTTGISQNRWGYNAETGWNNLIVPDRLVRTYEGYGIDKAVAPALDPHLVQSGTWLIDTVTYSATGDIVIKMRDLGRLLIDQIIFPPVVPYAEYPLYWETIHTETKAGVRAPAGGAWELPRGKASSSNDLYVGKNIDNPPYPEYVNKWGTVNGHSANDAMIQEPNEFWQAAGQPEANSKVWWQVDFKDETTPLAGLRVHPRGGPYRIFVSVKGPDGWIGKKKIPYDKAKSTGGVDLKADIPFVMSVQAYGGQEFDIVLPRKYARAKAVRITFTRLHESHVGTYPYIAQLRDVHIYTAADASKLSFKKGNKKVTQGNYSDFTDIVKWACAWGGFYWPTQGSGNDYQRVDGANQHDFHFGTADSKLPKGRVWGEFMSSGTAGIADLTVDLFDKKPLMDMVAYVRDMLGFVFFIDECGGVVWRMPNLWEKGNYVTPAQDDNRRRTRTDEVIKITDEALNEGEAAVLEGYETTLSSRNLRERVFVANTTGKIGTVIRAFKPTGVNLRRTAGWTDQNFETKRETRVMADMISAQQMFDYRTSHTTIPGNPAIQIDDQVRIFERVTNETYYHYVTGISCSLDMEAGEFTYELDTHWLGERPSDAWVVKVDEMDQVTQQYLNTVGTKDT
jgi:hypothetical protein